MEQLFFGGYGYYGSYSSSPLLTFVTIALVITFGLSFYFSFRVNSKIKKFTKEPCNINGHDAVIKMLNENQIRDVKVVVKPGKIGSEYFNPLDKTIYLSEECYYSNSISAVAIATHEAGHAVQLHKSDFFSVLRLKMARPVSFASTLSMGLIMIGGFLLSMYSNPILLLIGTVLFSATFAFQLVTLPVEFDASKRALSFLYSSQILNMQETKGAAVVLRAAAWTYIIATIMSFLQLLRFILILLNDRR